MPELMHRYIGAVESARLGVKAGWYGTKISGTFVSGPHDTETECLRSIAELNPVVAKRKPA
jgi:hypothetical protein